MKSDAVSPLTCQMPSLHGRRITGKSSLLSGGWRTSRSYFAFSLVELLVVIAVIAILAALLLPAVNRVKEKGRLAACLSNLKQVNLAIRLYADDNADSLPVLPDPNPYPNGVGAYYKQLVKGYLGLKGPAQPSEKVFMCPSDTVISTQSGHAFSSYTFNGYEVNPGSISRITGQKLTAIPNPVKAVLAGEHPGFWGGSWHPLVKRAFPDASDLLGFVDAHVASVKIYWNGDAAAPPCTYEPPPQYNYSWDGN